MGNFNRSIRNIMSNKRKMNIDWHKVFRAIAKETPESLMFVLNLGTTDITFWNREYQICERGDMPCNYIV